MAWLIATIAWCGTKLWHSLLYLCKRGVAGDELAKAYMRKVTK
jgi:hypothetical protein